MSVFEFPPVGESFAELLAAKKAAENYIETAKDPNEAGPNGQTLLMLAIQMCFEGNGESTVSRLIARGANPNLPSAWTNFVALLTTTNSIELATQLINAGLELNEIYETNRDAGDFCNGRATILDHVYGIREYISPKHRKRTELATRYAGGLGPQS